MSKDKLDLLPDRYKRHEGLLPYYLQLGLMNELQDALEKTKKLENTLREVRDLVQKGFYIKVYSVIRKVIKDESK